MHLLIQYVCTARFVRACEQRGGRDRGGGGGDGGRGKGTAPKLSNWPTIQDKKKSKNVRNKNSQRPDAKKKKPNSKGGGGGGRGGGGGLRGGGGP